ncbi:PhzF family phenazine biosynthesis protein [Oceanibacterium hippocampi]|uniref:Putative isomerase YddE n=1 Tax=Oceanibacterium hippocampi TaxID=745714 RepID=A0A1Y5TUZ3_9PROT|nr:PhzF family phenazine biosynthesis protein [Oceanibacterium hippocampi]SLN73264.1 putative isomerase YddE [Oceanibacterium hippocampi]
MTIPIYQVDAFTDRLFSGNPAAVCPLDAWPADSVLQAIAAENNLSETAYFAPEGAGFRLRWFTPACEIDLCGHATLASAFILFTELGHAAQEIRFETQSGRLVVSRDGDWLRMDFPAWPGRAIEAPEGLAAALGIAPREVRDCGRDLMAVYDNATAVRALRPDFRALLAATKQAVIATAPGEPEFDFVSRFFAPGDGIDEDPVTGSAHCALTPYWAERLGKTELVAFQASGRGGQLRCGLAGDRVQLRGRAVLYLTGAITLP